MTRRRRRSWGQVWPGKRKGTWRVRWQENGLERQRTVVGSRALAERFLAQRQVALGEQEALGHLPIEPIRFEQLLDQYETLFAGEKAPPTVIREARYLRSKALPFFKGLEVGQIRRAEVERWLMTRTAKDKIKPQTRNKLLNILSRFFQKAVALNHARENPVAGMKRQQEPLKSVPFVPLDSQAKLVAEMPEPVRPLIGLLMDTGLRLGEALRLEWRDVDWRRQILTVRTSKTKRGREVPFTERGLRALKAARKAEERDLPRVPDLVFPALVEHSLTGELRLKTTARKSWNKARARAGLPQLTIHDLRHVWAVTCVRAGITLGELRELGGWKSLTMVLRYSRHVPENTPDLARVKLQSFLAAGENGQATGQGTGR